MRCRTARRCGLRVALLCCAALLPPLAAHAEEDPPPADAVFDRPVTPPPDPRLAANRGLWLEAYAGFFDVLGGGRAPRGGGAVAGGWGLGNGLVLEGQVGAWNYQRTVGTTDQTDGALAVPILVGARYRFVTAWRYKPVPYAAAHLGPVVNTAWYLGPTATKTGFGLQLTAGLQLPLGARLGGRWLLDCSFGYLLDAGGLPDAGTIMQRHGTGHAFFLGVGIVFQRPPRPSDDPLGLRTLAPPAP